MVSLGLSRKCQENNVPEVMLLPAPSETLSARSIVFISYPLFLPPFLHFCFSSLSISSTGWFKEGLKLVHIDRAIIYRQKRNLASEFHTGNAEIGFPPPGDVGRHDAPRSRTFAANVAEGSQTEGSGANRGGSRRVGVARFRFRL
jgi:hypothetical protein